MFEYLRILSKILSALLQFSFWRSRTKPQKGIPVPINPSATSNTQDISAKQTQPVSSVIDSSPRYNPSAKKDNEYYDSLINTGYFVCLKQAQEDGASFCTEQRMGNEGIRTFYRDINNKIEKRDLFFSGFEAQWNNYWTECSAIPENAETFNFANS